jgi:ABC-type uncharacterized transport system substrate-binding protein
VGRGQLRAPSRAGGLVGLHPDIIVTQGTPADFLHIWRQSAVLIDRVLQGAKPADLPIQQATRFELIVNVKTAKSLGLTIPSSRLARADQVIE